MDKSCPSVDMPECVRVKYEGTEQITFDKGETWFNLTPIKKREG